MTLNAKLLLCFMAILTASTLTLSFGIWSKTVSETQAKTSGGAIKSLAVTSLKPGVVPSVHASPSDCQAGEVTYYISSNVKAAKAHHNIGGFYCSNVDLDTRKGLTAAFDLLIKQTMQRYSDSPDELVIVNIQKLNN